MEFWKQHHINHVRIRISNNRRVGKMKFTSELVNKMQGLLLFIITFFTTIVVTFFTEKKIGEFWRVFCFHLFPILETEKIAKLFS